LPFLAQEIEDLEGAIEPSGALAACIIRNSIHLVRPCPSSRQASPAARAICQCAGRGIAVREISEGPLLRGRKFGIRSRQSDI
jgi:hypothetical protein